jgi:hypothetical protein
MGGALRSWGTFDVSLKQSLRLCYLPLLDTDTMPDLFKYISLQVTPPCNESGSLYINVCIRCKPKGKKARSGGCVLSTKMQFHLISEANKEE